MRIILVTIVCIILGAFLSDKFVKTDDGSNALSGAIFGFVFSQILIGTYAVLTLY